MQELGSLVTELGLLKKKYAVPPKRKSLAATKKSPDERQWRSGLGLQEVENAMLPTISEDKFYPRKTLKYVPAHLGFNKWKDTWWLDRRLTSDSIGELGEIDESQSPDIGPPPVSRFTNEEPISFNPSHTSEEHPDSAIDEKPTILPNNFETRRKRRESGPQLPCMPFFESTPEGVVEEPLKTARAGAKRKFSVQEDEEKNRALAEPFQFNRRNTPAPADELILNDQSHVPSTERRALGSSKSNKLDITGQNLTLCRARQH